MAMWCRAPAGKSSGSKGPLLSIGRQTGSSNMLASSGRLRLQPLAPIFCQQHPPEKGKRHNQHGSRAVAARHRHRTRKRLAWRIGRNPEIGISGDDRALAIRDHILPLLREYGALEVQRDTVRVVELRIGAWIFRHWTPFNDLAPGEASSSGYRHAVEKQHTKPDLPYGLDVYHGGQVLSVLWADDGAMAVATFTRGPWEEEALAL